MSDREEYLTQTLLALPGWAGMIWQLETNAEWAVHPAPAGSLVEYVAVRLLLERLRAGAHCRTIRWETPGLERLRGRLQDWWPTAPRVSVDQRALPGVSIGPDSGLEAVGTAWPVEGRMVEPGGGDRDVLRARSGAGSITWRSSAAIGSVPRRALCRTDRGHCPDRRNGRISKWFAASMNAKNPFVVIWKKSLRAARRSASPVFLAWPCITGAWPTPITCRSVRSWSSPSITCRKKSSTRSRARIAAGRKRVARSAGRGTGSTPAAAPSWAAP